MKIYFAGHGHDIEKTVFIGKMKLCNFLLSYANLDQNRFLWAIGKKADLPQNIIGTLIKNYENIPCNMVGRTKPGNSPE